MYLSLKQIIESRENDRNVADAFRDAVSILPETRTATLDLAGTKYLYQASDVVGIVEIIREVWDHTAFCLAHCEMPDVWQIAAATLNQPLLSWRALTVRSSYQVLGVAPNRDSSSLLRALCYRYEHANADRLAQDPEIVSPRKMHFDVRSQIELYTRGRLPVEPTHADVSRIQQDLQNMVRAHYILHRTPGWYCAVRPTPPAR